MKKERKPRWKELSVSERLARSCKQRGVSEEMCDHIRSRDKSSKKMIFIAPGGTNIMFDTWEDATDDFGTYWVYMCSKCRKKYQSVLWKRLIRGGSTSTGCCVCGCDNNASDWYADFKNEEVKFE